MQFASDKKPPLKGWRLQLHEIIFEADTPAGKAFDVALIWCIVLSVIAVILESVTTYQQDYGKILRAGEWIFTIVFTIEYIFRLICVQRPLKYATSFFGIVDLLAIVPTYLSLFIVGTQSLLVIRALRLLRIFRVLKLVNLLSEAQTLRRALKASRGKITVFLFTIMTLILVMGATMYLLEGRESGFSSIPKSIYWAIVTMTTVGYGDVTPQTALGQTLASVLMIFGYAIIAVPTGIVTAELAYAKQEEISTQACPSCSAEGHEKDAKCCKFCGSKL